MSIAASIPNAETRIVIPNMAWEIFEALGGFGLRGYSVRVRQGDLGNHVAINRARVVPSRVGTDDRSNHGGVEHPALECGLDHAEAAIGETGLRAGRVLLPGT